MCRCCLWCLNLIIIIISIAFSKNDWELLLLLMYYINYIKIYSIVPMYLRMYVGMAFFVGVYGQCLTKCTYAFFMLEMKSDWMNSKEFYFIIFYYYIFIIMIIIILLLYSDTRQLSKTKINKSRRPVIKFRIRTLNLYNYIIILFKNNIQEFLFSNY